MLDPRVRISSDPNEVWLIETTLPVMYTAQGEKVSDWSPWIHGDEQPSLYDLEYSAQCMIHTFGRNWNHMSKYFRIRNVTTDEIISGEVFNNV